ncbi:MAG TPA: hypothetical protein VGI38_13355 [Puia sp.]|jgi:hypothetical protein
MKKIPGFWILIIFFTLGSLKSYSQCSICTRSVQQMGEKPGKAFNAGILYLAFTPLAIGGILGYKWWRQNR